MRSTVSVREGQGVVLLCGTPPRAGGKEHWSFQRQRVKVGCPVVTAGGQQGAPSGSSSETSSPIEREDKAKGNECRRKQKGCGQENVLLSWDATSVISVHLFNFYDISGNRLSIF